MAKKYHGRVGFVKYVKKSPGVWMTDTVEKKYRGDVIQHRANINPSDNVSDELRLTNKISIVCDSYAIENFQWIKYVEYMGVMWNVSTVEVQTPRLILTIGGVYSGQHSSNR